MDLAALHLRLDQIAPAVLAGGLAGGEDEELAAVEAHAATGCSCCARALVNARETAAEAIAAFLTMGPQAAPNPGAQRAPFAASNLGDGLRARVLASARAGGALAARVGNKPPRFFDPSSELSRLHVGAPGDAERTAEVDALAAFLPREGDACDRLLAQLERLIGFPLLFVSVVRGPRVGYRVQRGLDVSFAEMRDCRRETSFCTHTVSTGGPFVVPNAAEEPFFRGSNMVLREGVKAYVGVPLTTSMGITIGTVCAMDFRPRSIRRDVIRTLEHFTEPVLAEVERARRMPAERLPSTAAGAPLHRAPWFRALVDLDMSLSRAAARPSALLVAHGRDAELIADLARENEPAGRLGPDAVALLLPGADLRGAENRADDIREELAARGKTVPIHCTQAAGHTTSASWIEAALAAGTPPIPSPRA
ncbi:MAG: GAF domain-containing protein [Minicystis sp.]